MLGMNLCGSLLSRTGVDDGGFVEGAPSFGAWYCWVRVFAAASAAIAAAVSSAVAATVADADSFLAAGLLLTNLLMLGTPQMESSTIISCAVKVDSGTVLSTQALIALSTFLCSSGPVLFSRYTLRNASSCRVRSGWTPMGYRPEGCGVAESFVGPAFGDG